MGRRRHIKGLDKPSAGPLRFEADPLVTLAKQASAHEIHRLDSVAETMILVGVMAGKKVLAGHEMVTVGPAEPQFGSGGPDPPKCPSVRLHAGLERGFSE